MLQAKFINFAQFCKTGFPKSGKLSSITSVCQYSDRPKKSPVKAEPVVFENIKIEAETAAAKKESKRLAEFRKKLRETTPIGDLGDQPLTPPSVKEDPLPAWPDNKNPHTGEVNGPRGPEPTRYGDWERKGRVSDF